MVQRALSHRRNSNRTLSVSISNTTHPLSNNNNNNSTTTTPSTSHTVQTTNTLPIIVRTGPSGAHTNIAGNGRRESGLPLSRHHLMRRSSTASSGSSSSTASSVGGVGGVGVCLRGRKVGDGGEEVGEEVIVEDVDEEEGEGLGVREGGAIAGGVTGDEGEMLGWILAFGRDEGRD
ncbi:uncharacterized protein C8A04DRAFT_25617 [Dichotomopilus funicola]|uniref:Uncharacterized protein n=1 Tax=Dichotomopilus funicola TaxID=1934379 RepID=A0AAN6ZRP5_9PEZI|nr:hypothetical protein C8A04DRAFT_25617 [Dichotomopilus funicola]